jgi:two-component system OmpR family response regulator
MRPQGKISGVNRPEPPRVPRRSIDVLVVAQPTSDVDDLIARLAGRRLAVERADSPEAVARDVVSGRPDVVIIDLRADSDGMGDRMLSWVCRNATASPLAITDLDQSDARIQALQLGASDHLIAPFDMREGVVRTEMLIARRRAGRDAKVDAGDMTIDVAQRSVVRNGELVTLTPRELALLMELVQRPGEAISKHDLLCTVWRGESRSENVVEANVSSLRRKLHGLGPPVIHTVHRTGYVFRSSAPSAGAARASMLAERDRMVRERDAIIARRDELIQRLRAERAQRNK